MLLRQTVKNFTENISAQNCGMMLRWSWCRTLNQEVVGSTLGQMTLGKLFTHTHIHVTMQYNLVPAKKQ